MANVSLTASARSNLLSLQQTSKLLEQTQLRLATGKKVNGSTDNANAFFASAGFVNRANDFGNVKDGLSTALQTIKAASNAIDAITKVVQQAQGLITSALQNTDTTIRKGLASQYNSLLTQVNNLVADATFNGTNLLKASNSLSVNFNESATAELTVASINLDASASGGLNVALAASNFAGATQINASGAQLTRALTNLRTTASSFGTNGTIIQTRQDFTTGLIDTLQVASDNLVLADTNEEGANLQALQARLQLGVTSLGISGQQSQAILKLF